MNSDRLQYYLTSLVEMPVNSHSMEVVNRLISVVELPMEVIHLYISNCLNSI